MFLVGEKLLAKNFKSSCPKWLIGKVVKVSGPLSYVIKLTNRTEIRRHVDYVRKRDYVSESLDSASDSQIDSEVYGGDFNSSSQTTEPVVVSPIDQPSTGGNAQTSKTITPAASITTRRSLCERIQPQHYGRPILY